MRDGRGEELLALLNNTVIKLPTKQKAIVNNSSSMSYGQFLYLLNNPAKMIAYEIKREHPQATDQQIEGYFAQSHPQDIQKEQERTVFRILEEKGADGSITNFLSARSKNGFPLLFSIAMHFDDNITIIVLALSIAYETDGSSLKKLTSLTYNGKTLDAYLKGNMTLDQIIKEVKGDIKPGEGKKEPIQTSAITSTWGDNDSSSSDEEEVTPVKSYGRGGKAAVLLDKNGANFKFLPPPAEVRRIEAGLSHNSIRLQDFQDFIIKQANRDELELPDKLSVSKGNKVLQKAVGQAKEILDVYKKGKNPTGLTPRELLFLKRLEKYCFVSPDGLLFSIKKYNWLRKQRNFKQIVMDLFK